jgi:hypothetical protein|tara:strand:- start:5238 stop:5480 length:243 start_codon:yes stop_codon:yes gene_type:complete
MESKEVSAEEFNTFLENYPFPLEKDVTGISEPPTLTYNDFSEGKVWPESVVCSVHLYESYPDDKSFYPYCKSPNVYKIYV